MYAILLYMQLYFFPTRDKAKYFQHTETTCLKQGSVYFVLFITFDTITKQQIKQKISLVRHSLNQTL